ncbi:patatin [Pedobacter sp. HMF7647]|uniref:Patatin n=1 Tax=Hufsiella arboris TaxID=2695275 RepID=A0A7K1YEJ2_9SPHI|nr:patatin-like phospholipase family protein [Hufsiella arboris]MXV53027.1 patatin [Hufsiella arboris]
MADHLKVGIVLSGGGIRGIAHLGVLKALTDAGIKIDHVSGTSAGSIVGALFAQGHDPEKILYEFLKVKLLKFIRASFGANGLLSIENTQKLLLELIPHNSFEGLAVPLTIATTNFSEGTLTYFSSGELIKAIQASCAIPGVFKPVIINNQMYVDGGVLNNFPVEPLRKDCDIVIGSTCNHLPVVDKIINFKKLIERAAIMSTNADMENKYTLCDVVIEPQGMGATSIFDIGKTEEIYWLGYDCALKMIQTNPVLKNLTKKPLKIA